MKLLDRTLVNLSSGTRQDLLGHISLYELNSGNYYYVYFIEARYFGMKEVDWKEDKVMKEHRSDNEYHYSLDLFFEDKNRYLGWNKMFGSDFMGRDYEPILRAKTSHTV